MRIPDGGNLLASPQGDPASITAAASALTVLASEFHRLAGQVSSTATASAGSWHGPAASAFDSAAASTRNGIDRLADTASEAADALDAYGRALADARGAALAANQAAGAAQGSYDQRLSDLGANPPAGAGALARAQNTAYDTYTAAYHGASVAASHACDDATHAAQVCAGKLSKLAEDLKATGLHKFLDLMGGPNTVFGSLGVLTQAQSAGKLWKFLHDFTAGNFDALAKLNPTGWAAVEKGAAEFGPDSYQALKLQMRYMEGIAGDAWKGMADAAVPVGKLSGVMDAVGKFGFGLAVAGDTLTLLDGQATGLDKGLSAANLVGTGMAAAGTELGATALGLVGVNAVADWIPVVGEVVIAGTAAYLAGEWVYQHWDTVCQWGDDAGHLASQAWTGTEHLVGSAIHEGGQILNDAGHVASSVVHDLNPFNW